MKKIILLSAIALTIFASCNKSAMDETNCLNSVIKAYPNSDIYVELGEAYCYYIVDSTGLTLVKTMSWKSPDITSATKLTKIQSN